MHYANIFTTTKYLISMGSGINLACTINHGTFLHNIPTKERGCCCYWSTGFHKLGYACKLSNVPHC